jgi:hypothetical protein
VIRGDELLAVKFADVIHHVLIDGFVAEKDFQIARLEGFQVRTALYRGAISTGQVVNFFLVGPHAGDVIGQ